MGRDLDVPSLRLRQRGYPWQVPQLREEKAVTYFWIFLLGIGCGAIVLGIRAYLRWLANCLDHDWPEKKP